MFKTRTYRKWNQDVIGDRILAATRYAWTQHGIGYVYWRGRNGGSWLKIRCRARQSCGRNSSVDWIRITENALVFSAQRQVRKCSDRQLNLENKEKHLQIYRRNNKRGPASSESTKWKDCLSQPRCYYKRTKKQSQMGDTSWWQMSSPNGTAI